jgi:hypothetical protein
VGRYPLWNIKRLYTAPSHLLSLAALSVRYSYPLAFVSALTAQLGLEEATRWVPPPSRGPPCGPYPLLNTETVCRTKSL